MKRPFLAALSIVLFFATLSAQAPGRCGMSRDQLDKVTDRLLDNLKSAYPTTERAPQYIPVRMILVADDDGTGRVKERKVCDLICSLNQRYEPVGFRFYIENGDFKYLNDSNVNKHQVGAPLSKMKQNRSTKAINYFITDVCDFGDNPNGDLVILGYYTPDNDWLVIKESEVNAQSSTVAHETGHFFSLLHPFNGYDHNEWPAGSTACAAVTSPGGPKTEKVDGSNANTAGDFISDTPASYNFVLDQSDCAGNAYNGGAKDPACTPLAGVTQADNYMDYFSNCQTYQFTTKQIAAMVADRASSQRNYLNNTYTPPAESLAAPSDMCISPVNGAVTANFDQNTFKWNAVAGATLYLFEIGITSNIGSTSVYQAMVKGTEHTAKYTLTANKKTYWRVTPMNEYVTCSGTGISSTVQNFITGATSATVSIEGLASWGVSPNPVSSTGDVAIKTASDNPFTADVQVTSVSGQVVFTEKNHEFPGGASEYVLPTGGGLAAGSYLVSLVQPTARLTKKLVVF